MSPCNVHRFYRPEVLWFCSSVFGSRYVCKVFFPFREQIHPRFLYCMKHQRRLPPITQMTGRYKVIRVVILRVRKWNQMIPLNSKLGLPTRRRDYVGAKHPLAVET